jgi:hypothetical protein
VTVSAYLLEYHQPAEYSFSDFGTIDPNAGRGQVRPFTPKVAGASLLLAGVALLGDLTGTTIGGGQYGSIASFVTIDRTDCGQLAPEPSKVVPRGFESRDIRSDREEITWIKEHSGLTWDQLGKVFGVSRRAVHMWANGGRLNESNAHRLRSFSAIVRDVESEIRQPTPETVRTRLLQVESDGLSIVDRLRRDRSVGPTWGAPFGPERLVNAVRRPLRTPVGEVGQ